MKNRKKIMVKLMVIAAVFLLAWQWRCYSIQKELAQKILRFHVIANSDKTDDQELKLKIRDAVGSYLSGQLSGAGTLEESEQIAKEHMEDLQQIACRVVQEEGYAYPVSACLADVEFPAKTYGSYCFPAGTYRALEIVIGQGAGRNWWCVMYPNLCFTDSVYQVCNEKEEKLQKVLNEKEYEEVLASGKMHVAFRYLPGKR